jgi:hypothetical protein
VTIIPSDSFSIHWEKGVDGKLNWRSTGDSLILETFQPGLVDAFDEGEPIGSLPLTVYCGQLQHIGLSRGVARIDGTKGPARFAIDLHVQEAKLRFGGYFIFNDDTWALPQREYYDSIRIDATHSNILLQQNVSIRSLYVRLADSSQIKDGKANIEKPEIHYSDDSRLDLSGSIIRQLK